MRGSTTGTLLLTTIMAMIGWALVTLYNTNTALDLKVDSLALKVNTLAATQYTPPKPLPLDVLLTLKSEIGEVAKDQTDLRNYSLREFGYLDNRLTLIMQYNQSRNNTELGILRRKKSKDPPQ